MLLSQPQMVCSDYWPNLASRQLVNYDEFTFGQSIPIAPFALCRLPFCIARNVVQQMDIKSYLKFQSCSRYAYALADFDDYRIEFNIIAIDIKQKKVVVRSSVKSNGGTNKVPWSTATENNLRLHPGIINVKGRLTSKRCERLYKSFLERQVMADQMIIEALVDCEPGELVQLMELLEISVLTSNVYLKSEILDFSYVQQLHTLDLASCRISDRQLLSLKSMNLMLPGDGLTEKGINAFLKEWRSGKRQLHLLSIGFDVNSNTRSMEDILEGVNANPIWSPELHSQSIASSVPLNEIQVMWEDKPRSFYSMFLADAIDNIHLVQISKSFFYFVYEHAFREMEVFYDILSDDQYFDVFNSCHICQMFPCPHREE